MTKNEKTEEKIWLGLVKLTGEPTNSILNGCHGAYSTFLVYADKQSLFEKSAKSVAASLNLQVDELVWCEPLSSRLQRYEVDGYLLDLANKLSPEEGVFGKFHVWEEDD